MARRVPRGKPYVPAPVAARALGELRRPAALRRGPDVARFEAACVERCGARHAITLPYARVCLYYLLEALEERGMPQGSEICMPPITISDMVNMVLVRGHRPVFVDLGERTGNLCPRALEAAITGRTKAVLVTHLHGIPSDMPAIRALCDAHDLVLLEDVSQAMGASIDGRPLGTWGDAAFFSISTLKTLSTFIGGLAITDDSDLADHLRARSEALPPPSPAVLALPIARELLLRAALQPAVFDNLLFPALQIADRIAPGLVDRIQHRSPHADDDPRVARRAGMSDDLLFGFTELQARVGLDGLSRFDARTERRRAHARRLWDGLSSAGVGGLPVLPENADPVWWRFPLWVDDPDGLRAHLRGYGLDTTVSGLVCSSREPMFADFAAATPHAFELMDGMVFLPVHPDLDEADMDRTVDAVMDFGSGARRVTRSR